MLVGFPGGFEKVNSIFKELLSYATKGGYVGPLVAASKEESKSLIFVKELVYFLILCKHTTVKNGSYTKYIAAEDGYSVPC